MTNKILLISAEPAVLDNYRRMFHKEFEIEVVVSGEEVLALIQNRGPSHCDMDLSTANRVPAISM